MKNILVILLIPLVTSRLNEDFDEANFIIEKEILKNLQTEKDLKSLQRSIILQRNFECLNREYFELTNLREHEKNSQSTANDNFEFQLEKTCFDFDSLKYMLKSINRSYDFTILSRIIFNQIFNEGCELCSSDIVDKNADYDLKIWLYALTAATLITLSSFFGAFLIPLTKHRYYKRILMFLISLAIGTLAGTGFMHLIPQAYGLTEDINYNYKHFYLWKSLVVIGGLYLFFLVEQILRFLIQFRKHKKIKKEKSKASLNKPNQIMKKHIEYELVYQTEDDNLNRTLNKTPIGSVAHEINRVHLEQTELGHTIAPVAWIIIFGEGLHNLIDGLSIGAAFTDSILNGLSLSLAIICEEFPHKLGDFAILIAAGMPLKVALFCNFLSSCFIYIGVFLGIFAGENLDANKWIYAVAGGMFIYIAVCDMIPELGEMANEIEKEIFERESKNLGSEHGQKEKFAVKIKLINFFIQNSGMILGFGCMLLLALYADKIQL
ncbi:zinc transporter ZIP14 isoform X1 [Brachionus plicatilis]|uniref:Zinc transporter ZIP14 isoform X1 n=1 Tax=Brachionus plicatilis TaxID=10195 RepID=A0A3M7S499_BRAPC|nr:zinc transporter ZIP14 isoform X1 [Brachionus plicatilis]